VRVFISYRRDDTGGDAGRLYDRLVEAFGADNVCRDVDSLPAGQDYVEAIRKEIAAASVVLVLIGPRWLDAADAEGRQRLADENDLVRREVRLALSSRARVIPVLVRGASMPRERQLPAALARLSRRNAVDVRDAHFDQDVAQLVARIGGGRLRRLARPAAYLAGAAVLAAAVALVLGQRQPSAEKARVGLAQLGAAFEPDDFIARARQGDVPAVDLFLRAGMDPNAENGERQTALMLAARMGHRQVVERLLAGGARVGKGLSFAAASDQVSDDRATEMVALLIGHERAQATIDEGLSSAAYAGRTRAIELLLGAGAKVNSHSQFGEHPPPLNEAVRGGNLDAVRLLLSRGADPNGTEDGDWTALHEAVGGLTLDASAEELCAALIAGGARLEARASQGHKFTPLLAAIYNKREEVMRWLIAHGADVKARDGQGQPSLLVAARRGFVEGIAPLVDAGVDVNVADPEGTTALMVAARQDQPALVRALLAKGADAGVRDKHGRTALALAQGRSRQALALERGPAARTSRANFAR
jgi:ankyrin repeat protein